MAQDNKDYKLVTIGKRKFRVNRFDAFTGSYILFTITEKVLPAVLASQGKNTKGEDAFNFGDVVQKMRLALSREEFKALQLDCLRVCQEILPAGNMDVIGENGQFGVQGLENNMSIVLQLTIHALMFNMLDFFKESGLVSIATGILGSKPSN